MDYEITIIGAGFGGLIAAIELQHANIHSFIILEKAATLGGVWRDNTYPGSGCDVRSDFYSIKRMPNPGWKQDFSERADILQYLRDVAKKRNLEKHLWFNAEVKSMKFISEKGYWQININEDTLVTARVVILATGPFRLPVIPAIPGKENFKGEYFHSSQWNHNTLLENKKVAVIGTGSSAAQIVPAIAPIVKSLHVIQRTPAWVLYKWNGKRSGFKKGLFAKMPFLQKINRTLHFWLLELIGLLFFDHTLIHSFFTRLALKKLRSEVKDPSIREKLTPNYPLGCKRIVLSDDYYPAFNRNNVFLTTGGVQEIGENYLVAGNKKIEADIIVFATGFNVANLDNYIKIYGKDGDELIESMNKGRPEAFLGLQFTGFPHLCMQLGPNSGIYHSSVLHVIESQMKYIIQLVQYLRQHPDSWIDVKKDIQTAYYDSIQKKLKKTIWSGGCKGWFLNRKGMNVVHYPHLAFHYRKNTSAFYPGNYDMHFTEGNKSLLNYEQPIATHGN